MGEKNTKKVLLVQKIENTGIEYLKKRGYEVIQAPREDMECIRSLIRDCDGVISKTLFLDKEILSNAPKLKVVGKHGVGVDNVVNVTDANDLGICVVNTPEANANSVAEHTIGMILALSKNFLTMNEAVRQGNFFAADKMPAHDVRGKTLSLIGYGNIGKKVGHIAYNGLGMKIIVYDPNFSTSSQTDHIYRATSLEEALRQADYVSLHLPGNESTYHMIGQRELGFLKKDSCLINCARGSVLDTVALEDILRMKKIRAVALDVYETEPLETTSELLQFDNVLLTPHSSALSVEALKQMSSHVAIGVDEVLSGKIPTWYVGLKPNMC